MRVICAKTQLASAAACTAARVRASTAAQSRLATASAGTSHVPPAANTPGSERYEGKFACVTPPVGMNRTSLYGPPSALSAAAPPLALAGRAYREGEGNVRLWDTHGGRRIGASAGNVHLGSGRSRLGREELEVCQPELERGLDLARCGAPRHDWHAALRRPFDDARVGAWGDVGRCGEMWGEMARSPHLALGVW